MAKELIDRTITISKQFRKKTYIVILAIGLFSLAYLLLIALSIALLVVCIYSGIFLLSKTLNYFTVLMSIGLFTLGLMFFLFCIKFIFSAYRNQSPYWIEISEKDHPALFELIREVSVAVGTYFPRKVYLSYDVNASVFLNTSFWSLFFPAKRNLVIGLGLINSINYGELKAVIAHEFGHFSQKTTQLGSYIYTVNKVIYNLAYQYDLWDVLLENWTDTRGVSGVFATITFKLTELVRIILRKAYELVNIPYRGLRREQEYHADQIAALVAGKENMISGLRRSEFASIAFQHTIESLTKLAEDYKYADNLYPSHTRETKRIAEDFSIKFEGNLPIITDQDLEVITIKPRVFYEDQWLSHPKRADREKSIAGVVDVNAGFNRMESWSILNNPKEWQRKITEHFYEVNYGKLDEYEKIEMTQYFELKEQKNSKYRINDLFNGFYDRRLIISFEIDETKDMHLNDNIQDIMTSIYSKENKLKFEKLRLNNNDLAFLYLLKNKEIKTRYFEFDQVRYHRRDIKAVIEKLEKEVKDQESELEQFEKKAFAMNIFVARQISNDTYSKLMEFWNVTMEAQNVVIEHQEYVDTLADFEKILSGKPSWQDDELMDLNRVIVRLERKYKSYISSLGIQQYESITKTQTEVLSHYLNKGKDLMKISSFDAENFNYLLSILNSNHELILNNFQLKLKTMTDFQLENYSKYKT